FRFFLHIPNLLINFACVNFNVIYFIMARNMNTISLSPEFFSDLGVIAQDETLFVKLQKYVKKLISTKAKDDSLMTKDEFFAKLERSRKQIDEGNYVKFSNIQEFNEYFGVK
ncbi:MAG: hypothetical protein K6A78_06045, partial [Prevotella sp.]|nr:hypothetical protein [Prevotella sp.]